MDAWQAAFVATCAWTIEQVLGTRVVCVGDEATRPRERALLLANHRTRLDWMLLASWLARRSQLWQLKIALKSDLRWWPLHGPAMQLFGFIFMARSWTHDAAQLQRALHYYAGLGYPIKLLYSPRAPCWTPGG